MLAEALLTRERLFNQTSVGGGDGDGDDDETSRTSRGGSQTKETLTRFQKTPETVKTNVQNWESLHPILRVRLSTASKASNL